MKAKNKKIFRNPRYCQQAIFIFAGWVVMWKIKTRRVSVKYKTDNTHYWKVIAYGSTKRAVCWGTIEASHPTQAKSRRLIAEWLKDIR